MKLSEIRTVYVKELRSLMRDRHIVLYSVALPALLYPVLLLGTIQVVLFVRGLEEQRLSQVEVETVGGAGELGGFLRRESDVETEGEKKKIKVLGGAPPTDTGAVRERLLDPDRVVDAILLARGASSDAGATERDADLTPVSAEIYFSGARGSSVKARERLESLLSDWREERLLRAARKLDEDASFLQPLSVERKSHSTPEEVASHLAGLVLPLMMLLMTALGAYYPALDVTVGEKERGTLETTLLAPVSRLVQVAGKYLAVTTCALLSFSLNFASMSFTLYHLSIQSPMDVGGVHLGLQAVVVIGLAAIFLAAFFSAVTMLLAFLSRSFKESQSYVAPIYLIAAAPVVVATNPEIQLTPGLAMVPLVNSTLLFRDSLEGRFHPFSMALALGCSAASAALALWVAARLLARESIATGGDMPLLRALAQVFRGPKGEEVSR